MASEGEEIATLRQSVTSLETTQEEDTSRICCDIAFDRKRIHKLETAPTWQTQTVSGQKTLARITKIRSILKKRGGTAPFKDLRHELGLKPNQFSALVAKLDKRSFQILTNPRARDEKSLRLRAFT